MSSILHRSRGLCWSTVSSFSFLSFQWLRDLLPGEKVPDSWAVKLIWKRVDEGVEDGVGLGYDWESHSDFWWNDPDVGEAGGHTHDHVRPPAHQHGLQREGRVEFIVVDLLEVLEDGVVAGQHCDGGESQVQNHKAPHVGDVVPVSSAVVESAAGPQWFKVVHSPA